MLVISQSFIRTTINKKNKLQKQNKKLCKIIVCVSYFVYYYVS